MDFTQETIIKNGTRFSQGKSLAEGTITTRKTNLQFDRTSTVKPSDISGAFMELHFQMNGLSRTIVGAQEITMYPNSQSIFFVNNNNFECEHELHKNNDNPLSFFDIKLKKSAIARMIPEKLWQELHFPQDLSCNKIAYTDSIKPVTPEMRYIIENIFNNPFKGITEEVFIEAKIVELFLLQVANLKTPQSPGFRTEDLEKLIATKEYIDQNYHKKIRIIDLAKLVGTNQQMLKTGFKHLFGTTIFGYYNDLRMEKAKHLLLDEAKLVAEVADEMGYKNPHHFTVAFKKKFGVLPRELRGN